MTLISHSVEKSVQGSSEGANGKTSGVPAKMCTKTLKVLSYD